MKDEPTLRLAITGAPRTGKTTVSVALSLATGLLNSAISPELGQPSSNNQLGATVAVALRGFEQRLDSEARLRSGFISDGSVLNEWAVAESLRRTRPLSSWLEPQDIPYRIFEKRLLRAHAAIVSRRADIAYDAFIHLRIGPATQNANDFRQRQIVDRLLLNVLNEARIPYLVVGGSLEEIVSQVTGLCRLPRIIPVADAVSAASAA